MPLANLMSWPQLTRVGRLNKGFCLRSGAMDVSKKRTCEKKGARDCSESLTHGTPGTPGQVQQPSWFVVVTLSNMYTCWEVPEVVAMACVLLYPQLTRQGTNVHTVANWLSSSWVRQCKPAAAAAATATDQECQYSS